MERRGRGRVRKSERQAAPFNLVEACSTLAKIIRRRRRRCAKLPSRCFLLRVSTHKSMRMKLPFTNEVVGLANVSGRLIMQSCAVHCVPFPPRRQRS